MRQVKSKKEIEQLISNTVVKPSSQVKEEILKNISTIEPLPVKSTPLFTKKIKRLSLALAVCVLIFVSCLGGGYYYGADYQSVYIDIDPSIELVLNRFNKINDVICYDEEAQNLLANIKLKGRKLDYGMRLIIDRLEEENYLTSDAEFQISASSKENNNTNKLLEEATNTANKYMSEKNYTGILSSKALDKVEREEAKKADIPPGKYKYIQEILEADPYQNIDDLKDMKMKDLKNLHKNLTNSQTKKGE